MRFTASLVAAAFTTAFAAAASAQQPAPDAPPPAAEPPPAGAPGPGVLTPPPYGPPGGYQPGYASPAYGYSPPPPPLPPPSDCCRWSARVDAFDLVYRRATLQGEIAIAGPVTVEIDPSYIFGATQPNTDAKGFAVAGDVMYYFYGKALRGIGVKAHAGYERFDVTVSNPLATNLSSKATMSSAVLGALIGSNIVFGHDGGFTLAASAGVGYATAPQKDVTAPGNSRVGTSTEQFYTGLDKVRLLGSIAVGVTL